MTFKVETKENLLGLGRVIGYRLIGGTERELSFARPVIEGEYPRFHVYVSRQGGFLVFNLHLDQKRPSYEGHTAHSGEYDGPIIEEEAARIRARLIN